MSTKLLLGLLLVVAVPAFGAGARAAEHSGLLAPWVHPGDAFIRKHGFHGAQTCAACHPRALTEIVHTVHWTLSTPVRNVNGLPDGSWWGMANRQCALAGCMAGASWLSATDGRASVQAGGCGVCHIGALSSPPVPGQPATQAQQRTVDCLVCHAKVYDWRKRATLVTDASGAHWGQDRSLRAALSVTRVPTDAACLRCHEHAFSDDYKRGTPFTPANDVHARAGLRCVTCHRSEHHKIAKGLYESDMVANDLPDVAVSCSGCHGPGPHAGRQGRILNAHVRRLACQTCHITRVSGIVYENWALPVRDDVNGAYSALSRFDHIKAIPGLFVPTVRIHRGAPDYMWRVANSGAHASAQSWMAFATAHIDTPGAKIFPVRGLRQVMLFDRQLKMWQAPGMAFMKRNPETARMPLLLAPDRAVYNRTGNVHEAIDSGMKALGVPWSGQWVAMQVPGVSYISVNHGIRRQGLSCQACHQRHGVMNFEALGFLPAQVRELESSAAAHDRAPR